MVGAFLLFTKVGGVGFEAALRNGRHLPFYKN